MPAKYQAVGDSTMGVVARMNEECSPSEHGHRGLDTALKEFQFLAAWTGYAELPVTIYATHSRSNPHLS
jgi:hypothetical protein